MYKLIVLYKKPQDTAAFDKYYAEVHRPLAERIPGLIRLVVNRCVDAPWGAPAYYLMAELHYADEAAFKAAMASPEGMAAGADVEKFASGLTTLMVMREA